jgi:hypothetical protein
MINKALAAALSAFWFVPAVSAQSIFGAAFIGPSGKATLYTISPATGTASVVGPTGFFVISGIAFAPNGVSLYGVGSSGASNFALLRINPVNGASTAIGLTGLNAPCQDIAFRSDGTLFCYSSGLIYTLSTSTGAATFVGNTGNFPLGNALAFSSGNILYNANELELDSINQSTGAPTLVVHLIYDPAFGFSPRAAAMKFHPNGTLYAAVVAGGGGATASLGIINISTGVVTRVGPTTPGMDALAISAQTITTTPFPIPAPSSLLLVATGLALVVLYKARNRRRSTVAAA